MRNSFRKFIISAVLIVVLILGWAGLTRAGYIPNYLGISFLCLEQNNPPIEFQKFGKPVIYLYPLQKQDVNVQLDYQGKIIADYPKYDEATKGWKVVAYPDGHLINYADNQEYSYLFWEGLPSEPVNWDLSTGFVVKGGDVREFLQQTLQKIGLIPKEYNEFIIYWYPKMKDNKYNLIHFAGEQYTETAPLMITPKPDSRLRVFMVFKPLDKKIEIEPQTIQTFERKGFTVIEWGGTEIK